MNEEELPIDTPSPEASEEAGAHPEDSPELREHERRARLDQETAFARKAAADAQNRTAEKQERIEKTKLKQAKLAYKQARRENLGHFLKLLCRVPKLVWLIGFVVVLITVAGASIAIEAAKPPAVKLSTRLIKIVDVNKLSTARFTYEGIAEKYNDDSELEYRVFYQADVEASADMSKVSFDTIDEENKVVYPKLPDIELKPTVDDDTFEFFERNPQINTRDVIKICRKDAEKEIKADSNIIAVAKENLQDTITALTNPLLSSEGYTISWDQPPVQKETTETPEDKSNE